MSVGLKILEKCKLLARDNKEVRVCLTQLLWHRCNFVTREVLTNCCSFVLGLKLEKGRAPAVSSTILQHIHGRNRFLFL